MATISEEEGLRQRLHQKLVADASKVGNYQREVVLPAMEDEIARAIARRMGADPEEDIRPIVLASTALAAVLVAKRQWIERDGRGSYGSLVKQAFDIVFDACRIDA
jgi:hypothetical protein